MKCALYDTEFERTTELATQVYRRNGVVVTVTGIPASSICPVCGNAVLDWEIAQEVEDLILPLFQWVDTHTLPKPVVTITFPEVRELAA